MQIKTQTTESIVFRFRESYPSHADEPHYFYTERVVPIRTGVHCWHPLPTVELNEGPLDLWSDGFALAIVIDGRCQAIRLI